MRAGQRARLAGDHDLMPAPIEIAGPVENVRNRDFLAAAIA
jgi:hypothetical protein